MLYAATPTTAPTTTTAPTGPRRAAAAVAVVPIESKLPTPVTISNPDPMNFAVFGDTKGIALDSAIFPYGRTLQVSH